MLAPDGVHCAAVGAALGRLHRASATYRPRLTNRRGPSWWRQAARAVRPYLEPGQNQLIAAELKFLTGFAKVRMPRGAIHGDLFSRAILDGRPAPVPLEDAVANMACIDAAFRSAETGRWETPR